MEPSAILLQIQIRKRYYSLTNGTRCTTSHHIADIGGFFFFVSLLYQDLMGFVRFFLHIFSIILCGKGKTLKRRENLKLSALITFYLFDACATLTTTTASVSFAHIAVLVILSVLSICWIWFFFLWFLGFGASRVNKSENGKETSVWVGDMIKELVNCVRLFVSKS